MCIKSLCSYRFLTNYVRNDKPIVISNVAERSEKSFDSQSFRIFRVFRGLNIDYILLNSSIATLNQIVEFAMAMLYISQSKTA